MINFNVVFEQSGQDFTVDLEQSEQDFMTEFGSIQEIIVAGDGNYTGPYEVKPKIVEQTMPTQNKVMLYDMKVLEIPYYEVSNEQNGKTVVIGGN